MVDDPSAHPDLFPTEKKQEKERQRLFRIIEDLVLWENTTNEKVLQQARDEIWQSWRTPAPRTPTIRAPRNCSTATSCPPSTIPLPAAARCRWRRSGLGLRAYASDLNPVAVLINKAMIEIPPKFAGRPPVNPEAQRTKTTAHQDMAGRAGSGRGRALLRQVDARRGREADRPPLPQGRDHGRDGEGAAGPEEATWARSSP